MEGELAVDRPVLSALLGCLVCVCGGVGDGLYSGFLDLAGAFPKALDVLK